MGFVSITRSSTDADIYSFIAETIAGSFSGSVWTQLVVKKCAQIAAQPELMLTSDFVSVILNFQGMSRRHQEKDVTNKVHAVLRLYRSVSANHAGLLGDNQRDMS